MYVILLEKRQNVQKIKKYSKLTGSIRNEYCIGMSKPIVSCRNG